MFKHFIPQKGHTAPRLLSVCATVMLLSTGMAQAQPSANYYSLNCQENQRCYLATGGQAQDVAYGAGDGWSIRPGLTGTFICGDSAIFGGDPKRKTRKACYASNSPSRAQDPSKQWLEEASGWVPNNTVVWFGVDGRYTYNVRSGQFKCGSGMGDPWKGRSKYCFVANVW